MALAIYTILIARFLVLTFRAEDWVGVILGVAALVVLVAGSAAMWVSSRRH